MITSTSRARRSPSRSSPTRGCASSPSPARPRSAASSSSSPPQGLLRTSMELGGNAPFLVFADADVDAAVEGAVIAKMRNIGEACTAANRFHVAGTVADEFAEKLAAKLGEMKVGRGTEDDVKVGPLIDDDAARQGRRARRRRDRQGRAGRWSAASERDGAGYFYEPTVLGGVTRRRAAAQGGDLRPGRAGDRLRRRGRGDRRRQRHRVRPRRLRLHARHQARVPRRREARDRHGRPQPGPRLQPGRAVRRRQGSPASAARAARRASTST